MKFLFLLTTFMLCLSAQENNNIELFNNFNIESIVLLAILLIYIYKNQKLKNSQKILLNQKKKLEEANENLQEQIELALIGNNDRLWDWNINDNTVRFFSSWKDMFSTKKQKYSKMIVNPEDYVHPDDLQSVLDDEKKSIDEQSDYYENIHRRKNDDGTWMWILDRGKVKFDEKGKAIRMIGSHKDITDTQEMQLKYTQQAQIIDQIHDSVISTDLDGYITAWNNGSQLLFGYTEEEIIGKHVLVLYPKDEYEKAQMRIQELFQNGKYNDEVCLLTKSGKRLFIHLSLSILKDFNNKPIAMVGYSRDISKRKIAEEKLHEQKDILHHQAHHDYLTKLPNRVFFNNKLEEAIIKAKQNKTLVALFYIDLDLFKQINDSLGHGVGDKVLKKVSERLQKNIRQEDTLSRLGGDEFTLIIEDLCSKDEVSALAQNIIDSLEEPIFIENNTLYITTSIGISLYFDDNSNAKNLLKYADSAMYKAKEEGRNNFQFYSSELTEIAIETLTMEVNLRKALEKEEFVVYYQPQIDAQTNNLIGMEALIRWEHPILGLVAPYKFIPIAEKNGLIVQIDQWVMKSAMTQLVAWRQEGLNPGILSMNLAIKQLQKKDFLKVLEDLLASTKCKAQWIGLEITESQVMTNPKEAINILEKISDMGIKLSIDDFGTGHSSLSYLKKLPIDTLKIDRAFIKDIPLDKEDIGITKSVIALSKNLNLKVIAEGVETKEQRDFLVENACHHIQGYFYSKPITAKEFEYILINGIS